MIALARDAGRRPGLGRREAFGQEGAGWRSGVVAVAAAQDVGSASRAAVADNMLFMHVII